MISSDLPISNIAYSEENSFETRVKSHAEIEFQMCWLARFNLSRISDMAY